MNKEKLIKTLEKYDKEVNRLYKENKQLKKNIDKAIEQLKTANVDIDSVILCEIIQYAEFILKGSEE